MSVSCCLCWVREAWKKKKSFSLFYSDSLLAVKTEQVNTVHPSLTLLFLSDCLALKTASILPPSRYLSSTVTAVIWGMWATPKYGSIWMSIDTILKYEKRGGVSPPSFSLLFSVFFSSGPLASADKTHTEMLPFRQLSVSKCCSSSFTGLKPWMDMFLTGVCLQGTLVILSSAENNRVMLSTKVRMRGRQGKQLRPGCWKCCYSCQLYETIHPPILCPDSPFELQNNDLTQVPTGKATSQRRTVGRAKEMQWLRQAKRRRSKW